MSHLPATRILTTGRGVRFKLFADGSAWPCTAGGKPETRWPPDTNLNEAVQEIARLTDENNHLLDEVERLREERAR